MSVSFKAACIQMQSTRDPSTNRDTVVKLASEAANLGADYIQTPEMTNILDRNRDTFRARVTTEDNDIVLAALCDLARQRQVTIHIGSLAIVDGEQYANRAYVINSKGDICARYTKIHLFDVDLPNGERWHESATYKGGAQAVVTELPFGLLGLSICYDLRFPNLYRQLSQAGAICLTAPSSFTKQTGEAHWHILQRARAIENGAFMISAAQAGLHEDGRQTYGHSIIIDPWGRILAEADTILGIIMAEIHTSAVADARQRIPSLSHDRPYAILNMS
ncbi:carbon-nitrogen hydrolase family protein [Microvirga sp. W0021]|uniref:Carbon-nitrogen hydrolase family protein n=1 Tax=Hohaiivirga grylli TaxID=3133970 RepID=A0ABV0BLV9_9HYPH